MRIASLRWMTAGAVLAAPILAALGLAASAQAQVESFAGEWRITVDRGNTPRVGVLEIVETGDGYQAFIDGGPADVEIDGASIVLTMDWEDGGGLYHVSQLDGELAESMISGAQTEEGEDQGVWSAVPVVNRATGAAPDPVDLSGVWFNSTFDGTGKYTFEMTDEAREFQSNFKPMLDDPSLRCVSDGVVRVSGGPFSKEIIQEDDRIVILYEDMHQVRRIYMDGRDWPEDVDDYYQSMGYSLGRWDGSTLVIETRGLNDAIWHRSGTPISSSARMTEHIYKRDDDTLIVDVILEDPANYTRPLRRTTVWPARPDYEIQEYACDPHAFYRALSLDGRLEEYWGRAAYRR